MGPILLAYLFLMEGVKDFFGLLGFGEGE